MDRETLRKKVIEMIESNFTDSVVIWRGVGLPDDEYDETERFEALWITDADYERFLDFEWNLEKTLAQPNGFSIMVQCLSPEATKKYRWREYQDKKQKKEIDFHVYTFVFENHMNYHVKWHSVKWLNIDITVDSFLKNQDSSRLLDLYIKYTPERDSHKGWDRFISLLLQLSTEEVENKIIQFRHLSTADDALEDKHFAAAA
jgi:hypothetical protein